MALNKLAPGCFGLCQRVASRLLPSAPSAASEVAPLSIGGIFSIFTRNIIRCHFPRPSETKRINKHGFKKRMSTREGRRILMNRILKGRFVISH